MIDSPDEDGVTVHVVDRRTLNLFERPSAPYQPESATSKAAAASQTPESLTDKQRRVLSAIAIGWAPDAPGMTDEEIVSRSGIEANSVRPRRVELVARGKVKDSGKTRRTRSGRQATVWVLA